MRETATDFIEDALSRLGRAVHEHGSDLRNVQLATVSASGSPEIRTLVLRGFEWPPAQAEMHTDVRAAKAHAIAATDRVALLAWSATERLQLRLGGVATLHVDDTVARGRWKDLSANARSAYGSVANPGDAIADPEDRSLLPPDIQFRQFGVLFIAVDTIDVLRLGAEGRQTRAAGRIDRDRLQAGWVAA